MSMLPFGFQTEFGLIWKGEHFFPGVFSTGHI